MKLKALVITNLFPNNIEKNKGIFIKQSLVKMVALCDVRVVAPVPWFPFNFKFLSKWSINSYINKEEDIEGIKTYHPRWLVIPKTMRSFYGFLMFLFILPQVSKIKKSFDFDVIYAPWIYPDGFASVLLSKYFSKPVVLKALGCDINLYTKYFFRRQMISWALRKANAVITVSRQLKQKMELLNVNPEKITVVQNGVNTDIFKPKNRNECRTKLGLNLQEKIVLFIGSLESVKGVICLLNAFHQLINDNGDKIRLIMVGKGSLEGEIKETISSLQLNDIVTLVGDVSHDKIADWMNACDVFCLPSIREGMPNVVLEALACNKYVVATNVGGIPDMITSEELGILVPPDAPDALASAIKKAFAKLNEIKSQRVVPAIQSWAENAQKVYNILKSASPM